MCFKPLTIKRPDGRGTYSVPCGECVQCVGRYQSDWSQRLVSEAKQWKFVYYITLTYNNDECPWINPDCEISDLELVADHISRLPLTSALAARRRSRGKFDAYLCPDLISYDTLIPFASKVDVQLWIKKVRERLSRSFGGRSCFKYFICSEYGEQTLRPHYHAVIFCNYELSVFQKFFVSSWNDEFGHVDFSGHALEARNDGYRAIMQYVSKYVSKPVEYENPYVSCGVIPKPFRLISKGIGSAERSLIVDRFQRLLLKHGFSHHYSIENEFPTHPDPFGYGFYGYSEAFLSELDQSLKTWFISKNGSVCHYSYPKYWRDSIFPQKVIFSYKYNSKTHESKVVSRKVADKGTPLSLALTNYLEIQYFKRLQVFIDQAKAEDPQRTGLALFRAAEVLRIQSVERSLKNSYARQHEHYNDLYFKGR